MGMSITSEVGVHVYLDSPSDVGCWEMTIHPSTLLSCSTSDSIKYVQKSYWLKNRKSPTKSLAPDHLMCSPWSAGIHLQPLWLPLSSISTLSPKLSLYILIRKVSHTLILTIPLYQKSFFKFYFIKCWIIRILDVSRLFSTRRLLSLWRPTLIIHGPHVLQTDYTHLHLTTIIIIITAREFYSPSCNLQLMQLMLDFRDWFTVKFVDSAVLPLGQTIVSNISSQLHFETNDFFFFFQCFC